MSGQKWLRNRSECLFLLHGFAFRPKPFKNRQLRNENEAALSVCFCCVASPSGQNHSRTGNYVTKTKNKFGRPTDPPIDPQTDDDDDDDNNDNNDNNVNNATTKQRQTHRPTTTTDKTKTAAATQKQQVPHNTTKQ